MMINRTECPQITDAAKYAGKTLSMPKPARELTRSTPPKEDVIRTFGDDMYYG